MLIGPYSSLLTKGSKVYKIAKSDKAGKGYLSAIMYLAPHKMSGTNLCPMASKGCATACLFSSGHGRYTRVRNARMARTRFFLDDKAAFKAKLFDEITKFNRYAKKKGNRAAVRLNGTSDIKWERVFPDMFDEFPDIQFYDYTKISRRMMPDYPLPKNYHLTFSRSETNEEKCIEVLKAGGNVAVVFETLPKEWYGFPVYNADEHDLRFLDKPGVQGLTPKGRGKHDKTGFVIRNS